MVSQLPGMGVPAAGDWTFYIDSIRISREEGPLKLRHPERARGHLDAGAGTGQRGLYHRVTQTNPRQDGVNKMSKKAG